MTFTKGYTPWNKGRSWSPEIRVNCQCAVHKTWFRNSRTQLELALENLLSEFPEIKIQKSFGRFSIDAYLPPPYHLAFEADGSYWHNRKKDSDIRRDKELLDRFSLPVIRLSEEDLSLCLPKQS